ncbi:efflux RND transporter periplasmic adaptor subunit [Tunturiibacter gelidoferens]|jgi:HlyD family secretion protein|uniref:HlyD family secretion protein n=1 Tax=Tunturiibacter gelidiferens TaxID=3069689 RepID=A0A9X0QHA7_9BACT|nr:efflux RND transporter periplasmic adaptor subunit [Edaphobacter lichenicola]MBB5330259.1 HlyD family secretion protein [Edaphobacter lichenicola]
MSIKKIILIVVVVLVLAGIVVGTILHGQASVTKVATGKAVHQDLIAVVNGTGQIKPKTYVNIGATAFGRITHLYVKEGDHVKSGATLATVESVQPQATVEAQRATIASSQTDITSYVAAEKTAEANIAQGKADLEQKKLDYGRAESLYNEKLIAKQDYDAKKAAFDMAVATLAQRQAALAQATAQTDSQRGHMNQAVASQRANFDALDKTVSRAPFNGLVTNVPVREGETVVLGIQNAQGSTLMTLADMSVITAEVKVDETDIVNISLNQTADVTVDALPGRVFKGHVTEVGDQALLRTTGVATSQSTTGTEEAKDFKVVVTLDQVTDELRPGLSATAKITTAHKPNALIIPIQALVQRDPAVEKALAANAGKASVVSASTSSTPAHKPQPVQGVYVLQTDHKKTRANFVPITTGVTGATDIEVLSGLKDGDEIVTGRYRILRTLKSGTAVKIDNSVEASTDADKS